MQTGKATPNDYSMPNFNRAATYGLISPGTAGQFKSQAEPQQGGGGGAGNLPGGEPGGPAPPPPNTPGAGAGGVIPLPEPPQYYGPGSFGGQFHFPNLTFPDFPSFEFPQKTPQELALFERLTSLAGQMQKQGGQYFESAFPEYLNALRYFDILGGMRGKELLQQTIAPTVADINDRYRGAASNLDSLRGAQKDEALAELARSRVSDQSRAALGVQPEAMSKVAELALQGTQQGIAAENAGGSFAQGALQLSQQDRQFEASIAANMVQNQANYAAQTGNTLAQYYESENQIRGQLTAAVMATNANLYNTYLTNYTNTQQFNANYLLQQQQQNLQAKQLYFQNYWAGQQANQQQHAPNPYVQSAIAAGTGPLLNGLFGGGSAAGASGAAGGGGLLSGLFGSGPGSFGASGLGGILGTAGFAALPLMLGMGQKAGMNRSYGQYQNRVKDFNRGQKGIPGQFKPGAGGYPL